MSGIKVIQVNPYIHEVVECARCRQRFRQEDYKILTKNNSGNQGRKRYHLKCARQVNLIASDIWWNRTAKYKRYELLLSLEECEKDMVEEFSQTCYAKLPEGLKTIIDIYYLENKGG